MVKTTKFVPIIGTIGCLAGLMIDTYLNGEINENMFLAFMGLTVGGSATYGILKRWKK